MSQDSIGFVHVSFIISGISQLFNLKFFVCVEDVGIKHSMQAIALEPGKIPQFFRLNPSKYANKLDFWNHCKSHS